MLNIKTYTKADLVDLFNTDRLDSIKRTLTRLGYEFTTKGKGDTYRLTITNTPSPFKMFCIEELGFAASTDFNKLESFLYSYFCDDEIRDLPLAAMERVFSEIADAIERHTLSKWVKQLKSLDLIHTDTTDPIYYVSFTIGDKIYTEEIDEVKYKAAWIAYWNARNTGCYSDGLSAMSKIAGGKVFKKYRTVDNAIYTDTINRLIEILDN